MDLWLTPKIHSILSLVQLEALLIHRIRMRASLFSSISCRCKLKAYNSFKVSPLIRLLSRLITWLRAWWVRELHKPWLTTSTNQILYICTQISSYPKWEIRQHHWMWVYRTKAFFWIPQATQAVCSLNIIKASTLSNNKSLWASLWCFKILFHSELRL